MVLGLFIILHVKWRSYRCLRSLSIPAVSWETLRLEHRPFIHAVRAHGVFIYFHLTPSLQQIFWFVHSTKTFGTDLVFPLSVQCVGCLPAPSDALWEDSSVQETKSVVLKTTTNWNGFICRHGPVPWSLNLSHQVSIIVNDVLTVQGTGIQSLGQNSCPHWGGTPE